MTTVNLLMGRRTIWKKSRDDFEEESPGDDVPDDEDGESVPPRTRPRKPSEPSLMERFAAAIGYTKDGSGRFYHADGSWIERVSDSSFPWEQWSASGELIQSYWPKDHCLEHAPLQLAADVWELCDKSPEKHTLILSGPDGNCVEISGHRLRAMRESGELTLYPASYRLVYERAHHE